MDLEFQTNLINECNSNDQFINANLIYKKYDHNNAVLDGLNINIPKGHIYALLGPSGCGKTTLLKCLIGLLPIDAGDIFIFGKNTNQMKKSFNINLNELGFMPQDPCLFPDLTITEIIYYFAKLQNIESEKIKKREEFLMNLLNLPNKHKLIKFLSTGQVKRVSFACSLVHEPSVLVLDEPTVALDPILRKKIWDYLLDLANLKHTTIIITTHYIDEARYANTVGFMRNGKIIEENNPKFLMQKYQENVLEDVFYKICMQKDEHEDSKLLANCKSGCVTKEEHDNTTSFQSKARSLKNKIKFMFKSTFNRQAANTNCLSVSVDHLKALLYKDTIKCKRNKSLLFIQLIIPIIQITLFCLCIGKTPQNLKIGYVNLNNYSSTYDIGDEIINSLDNDVFMKERYGNFSEGYKSLKNGDIWGLISIDRNFSTELYQKISSKETFLMDFKEKFHIYLDNTNHQISYTIHDGLLKAVRTVIDKYFSMAIETNRIDQTFNDTAFYGDDYMASMPHELNYPINYEKPVYGTDTTLFTHFMAPGIAITVIFFLSVAATASNFVLERRLGLIERSYLCGIKTLELLISQIVVYSVLLIVQIAIVLALLFIVFKLPLRGSLVLLTLLIYLQGFSGLTYGLFVSSICSTEESVIQLTLASFYPILLMSGIIWPIEAQPVFLANISKLLPLTYATDALRLILEKGWNLFAYKVFLGFLSTFSWIFIFSFGFMILFSIKSF